MKKVIAILLSLAVTILLCSCGDNVEKITCHDCGKEVTSDVTYCPYCRCQFADDTTGRKDEETSNQPHDYSDFGFINNFGMTEFIEIEEYNFSDKNNSYVVAGIGGMYYANNIFPTYLNYNVISIANQNYMEVGNFNVRGLFKGNISTGNRHNLINCN